ncbi:MAG: hypothetical protein GVY16_01175 [Planctomycetes bacterium]|jgi:hypothetical protein|nr:hypothetical protein [Phycisphaerae bacterium]NBB94338.1 hypothetical protein [Planctomycetota bacterium]
MRLALVILGLAAVALALVDIRREDLAVRHEMQALETRHAEVRRELWSRQVDIGHLTTPQAVRYRADVLALELTDRLPSVSRGPDARPATERP